jgi:NAD(P)-dependent dehydrogenase (short-subunit alcohol dehydrogenase family)
MLTKEAIFHGVHAAFVHPGFTNTPMSGCWAKNTSRRTSCLTPGWVRLIEPSEIAEAICFLISNSEVSGHLLGRCRPASTLLIWVTQEEE